MTPQLHAWKPSMVSQPIRLGISQCLLGDPVRYDGGHKRDGFLVDILGQHVEWIPLCPEVEAGFGIPREPMRLVDHLGTPRLLTIRSHQDRTDPMSRYIRGRLRDLKSLNLSGYVFKKDSPSCGMQRVRIYTPEGQVLGKGVGLFAAAFQRQFPFVPTEEEGRLQDPGLRENFIERVFGYHRWQCFLRAGRITRGSLISFHTAHKYLLLAHSRSHYLRLGQLVANAKQFSSRTLAETYGSLFLDTLAIKTTVRKHTNVLQHLVGYFKTQLGSGGRKEIQDSIHNYYRGLVPLNVPLTLIRHYVRVLDIPYLRDQIYLDPHPKELMLRNHV